MNNALRLVRYLLNTAKYTIRFQKSGELTSYSDASLCRGPDGVSTGGYVTMMGNAPIAWRSWTIKPPPQSSAQAEYVAMSSAVDDIVHNRELLGEIGFPVTDKTVLYCDCNPAIQTATKPGFTQASKSIRLKFHNVRYVVNEEKIVSLNNIDGKANPADILTKPLPLKDTQLYCRKFYTVDESTNQRGDDEHKG